MSLDKIHLIFTGGTIDGVFNPSQYKPVPSEESNIPSYLKSYVKYGSFDYTQISAIDGLEITDQIRSEILKIVNTVSSQKIIITHGTDNMVETANYITKNYRGVMDKTIIFVGAMHPLTFIPSDAGFNLGYAIAKLDHLKSGVYICMNGHVFNPEKTVKNQEKSLFEEVK